jgi:hypothetical protein
MTKTFERNQPRKEKPTLSKRRYIRTSLTERQRALAYARYRAGDNIQSILADLELTIAVSQFLWIFPPDPADGSCARCHGSLACLKEARKGPPQAAFCTQCGHCDAHEVHCSCAGCNREKLIQYERQLVRQAQTEDSKLAFIHARYWSAEAKARLPNEWSTRSLLWLGANMLRKHPDEPLIPSSLEIDFRKATLEDGVQVPERGLSVFYFDDKGCLEEHCISRAPLVFARCTDSIDADQILSLIRRRLCDDRDELQSLWLDITTSECVQFASHCLLGSSLAGVQVPLALSLSIRDYLMRCPAKQVQYALYIAARAISAELNLRRYKHRVHAMNTLTKVFHAQAHRVEKEPELSRGTCRPLDFPRSLLSRYFFHHVLDVTEDVGFTQSVTKWLAGDDTVQEYKQALLICCPACHSLDATLSIDECVIALNCPVCGADRLYHA